MTFDEGASVLPLGCILRKGGALFRLYAPRATSVVLEIFERFEDDRGERLEMRKEGGGAWVAEVDRDPTGKWYGYRIDGPRGEGEMFDPSVLVADPWSKAVTTVNHWTMPAKTLIVPAEDRAASERGWKGIADPSELVIYECHVRDMTAHASAGAASPGTYTGLTERGIAGGLGHIRALGVNAVELLPVMKFGTHELPFNEPSALNDKGRMNDWNPYARNHWGYMTSFFLAPETYYATGGSAGPGAVNGRDNRAADELRALVRAFHREGIAVILDVVYNHTSHYDHNPFKYADKRYYYRCDDRGAFLEASGCGNDFFTERTLARRMIVQSVCHWLEAYGVDGFRFDLAGLLDEDTCRTITAAAHELNPRAVLIAEPWGGNRHHPAWFRELGWWSWNDRFRDGVKGRDPRGATGLIFGSAGAGGDPRELLAGLLPGAGAGPAGSLNYLEAHDGYTLGDFIRVATGAESATTADPRFLALNRFAALVLLTSPGPLMIHEGQEFGRSKRIVGRGPDDPEKGKLDHNSYAKDDATNYLDFGAVEANRALFDYYRGLIELRKRHPALGAPREPGATEVRDGGAVIATALTGAAGAARTAGRYLILLNPSPDREARAALPQGRWSVLADAASVRPGGDGPTVEGAALLPPSSGMVLAAPTLKGGR